MGQNPQIELARATLLTYFDCIRLASQGLLRNWPILVGSIGLFVAYTVSLSLLSPFGFAGGMVAGLVQIALLSLYYGWVSSTVQKERLKFPDLIQFDYGLFFNIMSVAFVIFIVQFLLRQLTQGMDATFLILCVDLAIVFVFNAIPEVIHLRRIESTYALSEAAVFTRNNWIEWYLPLLLLLTPWLLLSPEVVVTWIARSDPLLPPFLIVQSFLSYPAPDWQIPLALLGIVLANWFMIFRAYLFKALESGNRRQRAFQARSR